MAGPVLGLSYCFCNLGWSYGALWIGGMRVFGHVLIGFDYGWQAIVAEYNLQDLHTYTDLYPISSCMLSMLCDSLGL